MFFCMHREVTAAAAAIREIPPGDHRGPCRKQVNTSSRVHSAFGLALCPGTSPAGPCTDRLVTAICREETLVITLLRPAFDDVTTS